MCARHYQVRSRGAFFRSSGDFSPRRLCSAEGGCGSRPVFPPEREVREEAKFVPPESSFVLVGPRCEARLGLAMPFQGSAS